MVTLTTIGLGDFVPITGAGVTFHYFYCVIGLGLIALLLTAVVRSPSHPLLDLLDYDHSVHDLDFRYLYCCTFWTYLT